MILLILGLLYLDYIPKEFQQLRRKALKSSQLKLLSHEEPEPIILPGKPFITDSFVGSVLHPIFGITNKELKGFAISKTKEHIALIADRETENGRSILNKKSVFFGLGNVSVSLTEKFADDGEVAIFNITDIDPLAAFYNFDMKLSPLSYDCKAELGKSFGARCWASFNKSWDQANNKPKEIDLSDVITNQSIREKIKIYVGAKANGEASAIIEKRGASLQAKFDGSLKVLAGAGFHIDQIHYTLPRKEFKIDPIVFGEAISDLSFDIPHEIDISRLVSIDIHKGYTISTKHGISPDFRKEIKVGTISTDSEEKGNNIEENYIKADFKATFSIWPAIKIDLSVGSSINFGAEVGPELGIDVNLGIDKEQCTYPGLYGTFTPFVNSTCVFSGSLKIANLQLLKFTKPISHRIYEKVLHSGCFFDGASSKELEKDYIQVERNRTVIYIENPKLINKSMSMLEKYEPIFFVGQTSTNEKPFYLGPATVYFSDDDKVYHYRDFVYVPEYNNFDNISIIPLEKDVIDEDDITFDYPFDRVSATTKALSFDIISQNSNAIDMGNQVIFANSGDIKNFRSKFISGTVKSQPIGLILHNKKDGYFNDPFKYVIHDEINNDVDEIIFNWAKLEVIEVQGKEPFNLYFSRKYEDTLYLKGVNGYLLAENNQSMSSVFIEKPYLVKINPDYYDSDFVGYFQLTTQNRESIGFINITKKEATHNSQFTKELGSYKITFKANSTVDDVEYIVNLNNIEVNESEKDSLKGVVTRIFEPHDSDYKPKFYEGKETPCVFIMQANEIYGILRFHFVDPEYDMKKNNNVYAFIKLPGSIPLLTSSHCIDEKDSCYSIKLEYGKSVFETDTNKYILNIPFRRRKAGIFKMI
ncbi:hypothetical protein M9Y10_033787 [Tritrichomonas musculus]|uniref:Uncharacterized protein n=1 Tax=Tritrichomonas musculus TaxID=1915356 RepID=A0ABR2KD33_9EUKA